MFISGHERCLHNTTGGLLETKKILFKWDFNGLDYTESSVKQVLVYIGIYMIIHNYNYIYIYV